MGRQGPPPIGIYSDDNSTLIGVQGPDGTLCPVVTPKSSREALTVMQNSGTLNNGIYLVGNKPYVVDPATGYVERLKYRGKHSAFLTLATRDGATNVLSGVSQISSARIVVTAPAPYVAVRFHIFNFDNAVNVPSGSAVKMNVCPSESAVYDVPVINGNRVSNNAGDAALWTNVTFNGTNGSGLSAAPDANTPSVVTSDWMPCISLSRTDKPSSNPLLYISTEIPVAAPFNGAAGSNNINSPVMQFNGTAFSTIFNGLTGNQDEMHCSGNLVSGANPGLVSGPTDATWNWLWTQLVDWQFGSPAFPFFVIEFKTTNPVLNLIVAGDSTTADSHADGKVTFPWLAKAALSAKGKQIGLAHLGCSGKTTTIFSQSVKALAAQSPGYSAIYYQPFSVNDSSSSYANALSTVATNLAKILDVVESVDAWLIIETPKPAVASGGGAMSATEQAAYLKIYNMVKSFSAKSDKVLVLDLQFLHDPAKNGIWNAAYGYDQSHPNQAGHVAIGNTLTSILSSIA